ncbi:hypothetical protein EV182_001803 [Spiromyces aspiralis]|uniref:Uncharacterized protein n=1 Tax=Spiromyces aspiralis TaxID=68401 RepID=A0ACC1HHP9_9FUNG|nr:hypothetical protein EV182_001803 [Spiromyces aspiralis]
MKPVKPAPKLKYGLNVRKPQALGPKSTPSGSRPSVFGTSGGDGSDDDADGGGRPQMDTVVANDGSKRQFNKARAATNKELLMMAEKQKQLRANAALQAKQEEIDPSIYDYDSAYDAMKNAEMMSRAQKDTEKKERKSKYIESLLKTAERRQLEMTRIREKKIQKEREAEGELYADKEKFVTAAYKEKLEEMRRLEEEEKRREEHDGMTRKQDMSGFYRNYLDESEKKLEAARQVSLRAMAGDHMESQTARSDGDDSGKQQLSQVIEQARARGEEIILNEDNQVVDKRQLLKSGLNIVRDPGVRTKSHPRDHHHHRQSGPNSDRSAGSSPSRLHHRRGSGSSGGHKRDWDHGDRSQVSRQVENMIADHLAAQDQQKAQELEKLTAMNKRRNDNQAIMDAKARYLARKRAREQQQQQQ